jgi:hypothetical protein
MDTLTRTDARINFAYTAATGALDDAGYLPGSVELDIAEPCWLYAGQITERATGVRLIFTYRSVELRDHDELPSPRYKRLTNFVGGAPLIGRPQVIEDDLMMFGQAELIVWEAANR